MYRGYIIPVPDNLDDGEWVPISSKNDDVQLEKVSNIGADGYVWVRKKSNHTQLYAVTSGNPNTWRCAKCAGDILSARIAHPVWDGPFPCSGSGQCDYENATYCPTCETKPSFHGSPVRNSERV